MTEETTRLLYVKDHLTGVQIPVRYIEPGTETVMDDLAALEDLARVALAAEAEFDAEMEGRIPQTGHMQAGGPAARMWGARKALTLQAAHLTIPPAGMTSTPMRTLLAEVCD